MQLLIIIISLGAIAIAGNVVLHKEPSSHITIRHISPSPTNHLSPTDTASQTPSQSPTITLPTTIPMTPTDQPQSSSLSLYIYPNSQTTLNQNNKREMESNDTPAMITDWYKNLIKTLHLHNVSVVTNNINDNITNQISAGNDEIIHITITKSPNDTKTAITISK